MMSLVVPPQIQTLDNSEDPKNIGTACLDLSIQINIDPAPASLNCL